MTSDFRKLKFKLQHLDVIQKSYLHHFDIISLSFIQHVPRASIKPSIKTIIPSSSTATTPTTPTTTNTTATTPTTPQYYCHLHYSY
eukprot:Awhi_evm1s11219